MSEFGKIDDPVDASFEAWPEEPRDLGQKAGDLALSFSGLDLSTVPATAASSGPEVRVADKRLARELLAFRQEKIRSTISRDLVRIFHRRRTRIGRPNQPPKHPNLMPGLLKLTAADKFFLCGASFLLRSAGTLLCFSATR